MDIRVEVFCGSIDTVTHVADCRLFEFSLSCGAAHKLFTNFQHELHFY